MKPLTLNAKGMIGFSRQLGMAEVALDISSLSGVVAIVGENGCLIGSTLVDMPRDLTKDPQGIPIETLVGTEPIVYARGSDGSFQLARATNVRCTGQRMVYRVRFKVRRRGRFTPPLELIGTADHPVMAIDGSYIALNSLRPGDRVCAMQRRLRDGVYAAVVQPEGRLHLEHRLIGGWKLGRELSAAEDAHHDDRNALNNSIDNIVPMNSAAHYALHGSARPPTYDEHPRGMLGKRHTPETKALIAARSRQLAQNPHIQERRRIASERLWDGRRGPWADESELKRLYVDEKWSTVRIADHFGTNDVTIGYWLQKFSVPRRNASEAAIVRRTRSRSNHIVIAVEPAGWEYVYDMEVPGYGNFIANGVVVHNSGKTTALELCQPFRYMPSRNILLHQAVESRTSFKDLTFRWDGKTVRSLININADTGKSEGFLYVDGAPKSSGLVSEHDEQLEKLLGPQDVFFHSVFAGQMADSLFSARIPPSKRKEFFVEFLGLGRLQEYSDRAKAVVTFMAGMIQSRQAALGKLRQEAARVSELETQLAQLGAAIDAHGRAVIAAMETHEREAESLRQLELSSVDLTATRDQQAKLRARWKQAEARHEEQIRRAAREATALRTEGDRLTATAVADKNALQHYDGPTAEEAAKTVDHAASVLEQIETGARAQYEIRLQLGQLRQREAAITADMKARKRAASELSGLTAKIPDNADRDICGGCGFAAAAIGAKSDIDRIDQEYAKALEGLLPQIHALEHQLLAQPISEDAVAAARREYKSAKAAYAKADEIRVIHERIASGNGHLGDVTRRYDAAQQQVRVLQEEYAAAEVEFRNEDAACQRRIDAQRQMDQALTRQKSAVLAANQALETARGQAERAKAQHDRAWHELERARKAAQELQTAEAALHHLDAERAEWLFLQTVCGRDKLQALELDAAAPAITTYANQLLAECFGGRLQIQFQTLNDAGREVFDLMVTDVASGKTESLLLKSGGQKVIVLHALRLAIALYGKDRAGRNFETLFMDESEAALSPATRLEFAGMLRSAMRVGGFPLALVVTHSMEVADCADRVIEFKPGSIEIR